MTTVNRAIINSGRVLTWLYGVIMLAVAVGTLRKPAYNWDMLPYMGVVISYSNVDMKAVHEQVYAIAREQVPPVYYQRMVDPANAYRSAVAQNPATFGAQFPFYIVKPLYTRIAWLLYQSGVSLINCTVWPSVASWWGCSLLLFGWIKKCTQTFFAFIASMLVMLSPPLLTVASLSTPDALSGLLLFTAIYLLAEHKSIVYAMLFFLMAVFARIDNIIALFCCLPAVLVINKRYTTKRSIQIISMAVISLLACFLISWPATSYGWSAGYYPSIAKHLNINYTAGALFDIGDYLALAKAQLTTGLYFSFIAFFLFLSAVILYSSRKLRLNMLSTEQLLVITFIAIVVIRFILQPVIADRLYIPWYLCTAVFLVKKIVLPQIRKQ